MGLEPSRRPDPLHRRRLTRPFRHRPARPVRLALRFRVQRQVHDLGDFLLADRRFAATSFSYLTEPDQSVFLELPRQASTVAETPRPPRRSPYSTHHRGHSNACARCTTRCAAAREPANVSNTSRCPSDIANGAAARLIPHSIMHRKLNCRHSYRAQLTGPTLMTSLARR